MSGSPATVRPSRRSAVGSSKATPANQLPDSKIAEMVASKLQTNAPIYIPSLQGTTTSESPDGATTAVGSSTSPYSREIVEAENDRWRLVQRGKTKTMHAALFVCLNIGVDP